MVYFVQDMRRDLIKIGYVDVMSVEDRVHQIRLNNRGLIRLLATIEGKREPERSSKSVEKTFENATESPSLSLPCVVSVNDSAKDNTLYEMDNLNVLRGRRINYKMKRLNHRVYFVRCKDFIKIGCTKYPFQSRISAMQVGNPFKLEGLGVIECDCPGKTKKPKSKNSCSKERDIQSRFKQIKARENSEWYHKKSELLDYIEENALESCSNGRIRYSP